MADADPEPAEQLDDDTLAGEQPPAPGATR
jgi:hypothetical protein